MSDIKQAILDDIERMKHEDMGDSREVTVTNDVISDVVEVINQHLQGMVIVNSADLSNVVGVVSPMPWRGLGIKVIESIKTLKAQS